VDILNECRLSTASGTERSGGKKKYEKTLVGGRIKTPLVGVYYIHICIYKKIYIIYGLQTETVAVSFAERGENVSSR